MEPTPYEQWRGTLVEMGEKGSDNAMYALLPLLGEVADDDSARMPEFDCSNLTEMMMGTGISCPATDQKLMVTYLDYFVSSGFLHNPHAAPVVEESDAGIELDEHEVFEVV